MSNTLGAALHESEVNVRLTGRPVHVPGNMISKSIYRYHCIRCTSVGSKILGAAISPFTIEWINAREKFDFCMHYLALPMLIVAVNLHSDIFWDAVAILFGIHFVNIVAAFMFFAMPIQNAKAIALIFATKDGDNIGDLMNNFITITASQRSTYVATDEQSAIFLQAQVSGQIEIMLYNQIWSANYNYMVGYLNCFVPFITILVAFGSASVSILIATKGAALEVRGGAIDGAVEKAELEVRGGAIDGAVEKAELEVHREAIDGAVEKAELEVHREAIDGAVDRSQDRGPSQYYIYDIIGTAPALDQI
eukprot:gene34076-44029_t